MDRRRTPELMDDPGVDARDLSRSLAYIRGVNRFLGGRSALLTHLRRWSSTWTPSQPITLLDIATGSADLPLAASAWAREHGFDLRITALDAHAKTVEEARRHTAADPAIRIIRGDALDLDRDFGPASFDYVHTGLFLHHLDPPDIVTVLRGMRRIARRGVIWNDLVRSRAGLAVTYAMTVGQPRIVRHDARASMRASFTEQEAIALAREAGWANAEYRWSVIAHRFTICDMLLT